MNTWLTADWHLGENRFELMARPFESINEHVYTLVENHNAVVKPEDMVIMNGDVCYQKAPEWLEHVSHFNGKKILIRGNHDRVLTDEQLKPYFEEIIPDGGGIEMVIEGIPCYITHYPTEGRKDLFNLVGHIHAAWKYQLNMFNVGVDVNHFRPVNITTIPFHLRAISEFYDNDVWVAYNQINSAYVGKRGKKGTYFRPLPNKT
jgi:calcineurin-like phosphoesterase family protein